MLENLPEVPRFGYWSNTKYFIGNDGMRTLNNLKLEHDSQKPSRGGYRLQKWQQEQKDKETKRKQQMFRELGLGFVKVKPEFKARDLTQYEERKFNEDAILLSSKSLTDELLDNL